MAGGNSSRSVRPPLARRGAIVARCRRARSRRSSRPGCAHHESSGSSLLQPGPRQHALPDGSGSLPCRDAAELARQPGLGSAENGRRLPAPNWPAMPTVLTIVPGICVAIVMRAEATQRLCGGWAGVGNPAPAWFPGSVRPDRRRVGADPAQHRLSRSLHRTVGAFAERGATSTQAWRQIRPILAIATAIDPRHGGPHGPDGASPARAGRCHHRRSAGPRAWRRGEPSASIRHHSVRQDRRRVRRHGRPPAGCDKASALTLRLFQVQEDERLSAGLALDRGLRRSRPTGRRGRRGLGVN